MGSKMLEIPSWSKTLLLNNMFWGSYEKYVRDFPPPPPQPSPQSLGLVMEDSVSLGLGLPRIPPSPLHRKFSWRKVWGFQGPWSQLWDPLLRWLRRHHEPLRCCIGMVPNQYLASHAHNTLLLYHQSDPFVWPMIILNQSIVSHWWNW